MKKLLERIYYISIGALMCTLIFLCISTFKCTNTDSTLYVNDYILTA